MTYTITPHNPSPNTHCIPKLLALTLLLLALALPTRAANDFDHWYLIEMQGTHAGWMHESQTTNLDNSTITTEQEMVLTIKRGTQLIKMRMLGRLEESTDHKPIRLYTLDALGAQPKEITYTYQDNSIITNQPQPDKNNPLTAKPIPLPDKPFQTPAQTNSFLTQQLKNENNKFNLTLLDPLSGPVPVNLHYTIIDRNASINLNSKSQPAIKWVITQDGRDTNLQSTEWVNENAQLLKGETSFGPYTLNFILTDETHAKQLIIAPELLVSTFIKPDKPIRNPRRVKHAKYQFTVTKGNLPSLPTTGSQTILNTPQPQPTIKTNNNNTIATTPTIEFTVDTQTHHPATASELNDKSQYLADSPYINSKSQEILTLVDRALHAPHPIDDKNNNTKKVRLHAEKLRAFVNHFVRNKNLSVGFASADEVAQSRKGDCTEHAVLLTAMLRADHIPARIASGLIYAESFAGKQNIFGYHMWTQALIDNKWIDLDATLRQPFDATHITLQTTPLNDDSVSNTLSSIATLFGRLQIKVIEISY